MSGDTHQAESASSSPTHCPCPSPSAGTVTTLEWSLPSARVSITVANPFPELITSFVTPQHRSDPPNYLGVLMSSVCDVPSLTWAATIAVAHNDEAINSVRKRFIDRSMAEIRLDPFLEGLLGSVQVRIELHPLAHATVSSTAITSRVLIVEGHRFEVSAESLALSSPYFESLFFGPFNEATKTEINIDGVSAEEFARMMATLTRGEPVQEDTVVELLMMSDRFDVPFVKDRCEDFLIAHETLHSGSRSTAAALTTLLLFANKFRLDRFTSFLISRMDSITQVVECMELFSVDQPISRALAAEFGARIRRVPFNLRPKIYLDLSDSSDAWSERVTFELFSDLCPSICARFIAYCQGTLHENGCRLHLRGTPIHIVDTDALEIFPVDAEAAEPFHAIPEGCDERNDLVPFQGCLIASRESLVPQVDYPVTLAICFGNPFHFGRSSDDVVVFGRIVDNREALENVFYYAREKHFMIGESAAMP